MSRLEAGGPEEHDPLADLVAGQVQAKLDHHTQSKQFIADRKLNLLAVTSIKRLQQIPTCPP